MINVFQPTLGKEELEAIGKVFESNWIGKGRQVAQFEEEFGKFQGIDFKNNNMITTTCATEALFSVVELLDLKNSDEVIMPSVGFVATASAVCSSGGTPVFSDVHRNSLNSTLSDIEQVVTKNTKAIIANHYGGHPTDIDKISQFCIENDIVLIEDSACAISAKIDGKAVGTFGDYGIWSFDSMKVLVTGDGGMVYVSTPENYQRLKSKFYLGLVETSKSGLEKSKDSKDKWWEYQINGYHRRAIMNDLTASIGRVQLTKLEDNLLRRKRVAEIYRNELKSVADHLTLPPLPANNIQVTDYLFWIQLKERDELASFLLKNNIYTTFRYWPLHLVDKFKHGKKTNLDNSEFACQATLNLPCHQAISDNDLEVIIAKIKEFCR
jgi:dTDP-4-amino-4,6-dideoxygalactose transaminase